MAHRSRLAGFIIDCEGGSLAEAASFWSQALGLAVVDPDEGGEDTYARLDGSPLGLHIEVQKVSHPSRVHLDIESDDIEAEAKRLIALGAKEIARPHDSRWIVLEAPTGQRFCVVRAQAPLSGAGVSEYP
ncbi:MAG TPA: VOC family protein [Arenimonas sp.]|nr:VOC family protein [Arenimonas sp.]